MCSVAAVSFVSMAMQAVQSITEFQRKEADLAGQRAEQENQARYEKYQAQLKENQILQNEYDKRRDLRTMQRRYAQQEGKYLSLLGTSGVETNSGSALDVLLDSTADEAEDLFSIKKQAERQQQNLAYEASLLRTRAKNTQKQAKDRRTFLEKGLEYYNLGASMAPSMNSFMSSLNS